MRDVKAIKADLKTQRADMRAAGLRRTSCFNGGMSRESQRANERCFALETELRDAQSREG